MADELQQETPTGTGPADGLVRVLLVVDDDALTRLGTPVRHLCVGMIDEAVQMTVLSRSSPSIAGEAIGPSRVIAEAGGGWLWSRPPEGETILERLGGRRPQVVHCLSADLGRWAAELAGQWNAALVVQVVDAKDVRDFRRLLPMPHLTAIATAASLEDMLARCRDAIAHELACIPLGIPAAAEPASLARPERIPTVITTAAPQGDSGLEMVLWALHKVIDSGQELHLFVLSEGRKEARFRRLLDRLNLRAHVTFAGCMADAESFHVALAASDFYLVPMAPSRFSVNTLTAMSLGLTVLAPVESTKDYLIDGQTACLFTPRSLAEKWLALLTDRTAARQLAHGAQDYVRAHHKASAMVGATAALYRRAVARVKEQRVSEAASSSAS